jgi:glycosyltransferase involved in cell wall biosynthesis
MAAGSVTLGTDAGGTREIIVDGETGFLYPAGADGQALLAARIEELVQDRQRAASLGAAGRERAASVFSESRFFKDFEDSLRPLLCDASSEHPENVARPAHATGGRPMI